jgi:hypothetical protein
LGLALGSVVDGGGVVSASGLALATASANCCRARWLMVAHAS